jgi:hypothetical protein
MPARMLGSILRKFDKRLRTLIPIRRLVLRLQSLASGVAYRTLKLQYVIGIRLHRVLIVERGTGLVLDDWSAGSKARGASGDVRQQRLVSDIRSATDTFSKSWSSGSSGPRPFDFAGTRVHVCANPSYIVAAACSGEGTRLLEDNIGAALRRSREVTPALRGSTGAGLAELHGTAGKVAATMEQLLADEKLPGHAEAPRPLFAYGAIAVILLAGITVTGEALLNNFRAWHGISSRELEGDMAKQAPSGVAATRLLVRPEIGEGGHAVRGSLAEPMKPALSGEAAAEHGLFIPPAELAAWQLNRSLLQFPAATIPAPGASFIDEATRSALSQLPNFDAAFGAKIETSTRFDAVIQDGVSPAFDRASALFQAPPIAVSDQGVKVGLFSTGSGSSLFSPVQSGFASGVGLGSASEGNLASSSSGIATGVTANGVGAVPQAVTQTLGNATSTLRGLGR